MGFWGRLFDFNRDGILAGMERAADFSYFLQAVEEEDAWPEPDLLLDPEEDWYE